ncbi:hypothetical protein KFK09_026737 [Dendrobium nobile]|uniref:Uncharacterized protein n=1 Tax=Dendrobium nobile TaxID=94219 RepID=A0A8T3A8X6_DENNO|nr:hypothetical protein KFK09_026737 [Dendrobium nobile]
MEEKKHQRKSLLQITIPNKISPARGRRRRSCLHSLKKFIYSLYGGIPFV